MGIAKRIILLSLSMLPMLTIRWFVARFSVAGDAAGALCLELPAEAYFYHIVDFALGCIFPIIWLNLLLLFLAEEQDGTGFQIRVYKGERQFSSVPVSAIARAAYSILAFLFLLAFSTEAIEALWYLDISLNEETNQTLVRSDRLFLPEGLPWWFFAIGGILFVAYIFFQPSIASGEKSGEKYRGNHGKD